MANLGNVSVLNINGNELSIKDAALTEIVNEIIEAIGANNNNIAERINNLHDRSFDAEIKISSQSETEISNIVDGLYKLQYVTITGEGTEATETLNNSAILIQKGTNQYLIKDGQILSRTKTNDTWGTWTSSISLVLSSEYEMSSATNSDLALEGGDSYEEAFAKIEKTIYDNEYVISSALNDLNEKIEDIPTYDATNKLSADFIEDGTTNKIINVKPDWEAAAGSAAEILNKPDLSNFLTIETQSNWNETNTSSAAYIQNKPTIPAAQIQADWNQTTTTAADYIKNKPSITQDHNNGMIINPTSVFIDTNNGFGGIDIDGGLALTLTAMGNSINFQTGAEQDQLKIYGAEGVFIEGANNKNIKLTTSGNGKAYYNNNEIATKTDIPTTSTSVTQNDANPVSGGAVYTKFADLIGSAPAALDTLQEIATALNNDADLAGTLTTQISSKVPKVSNPTTDNFASFNSDGTIKDSGHSHSDYITSIKTVNNESLVGTGNIVVSGLPQVSASDNGKILMVVNGQWQLVSPSVLYTGQGVPNNAQGNNGDLYMQTD